MKINKKKLIIKISLLLIVFVFVSSSFSLVFGGDNFNPSEFEGDGVETEINTLVDNTAGTLVAVLRVVSVAIAIVALLVIAMRYMVSSAGDRADIKKHAVAYVVGTFILFGVTQIIAFLIDIANNTLLPASGGTDS